MLSELVFVEDLEGHMAHREHPLMSVAGIAVLVSSPSGVTPLQGCMEGGATYAAWTVQRGGSAEENQAEPWGEMQVSCIEKEDRHFMQR